jgi:hypothetical protein
MTYRELMDTVDEARSTGGADESVLAHLYHNFQVWLSEVRNFRDDTSEEEKEDLWLAYQQGFERLLHRFQENVRRDKAA